MKKNILILGSAAALAVWYLFRKSDTVDTLKPQAKTPITPATPVVNSTPAPVYSAGTVIGTPSPVAAAVIPTPSAVSTPSVPVYTGPPRPVAETITEAEASRPYYAQQAQAEEQRIRDEEAQRIAARDSLLQIEEQIRLDQEAQRQTDADTLARQQELAEQVRLKEEATARQVAQEMTANIAISTANTIFLHPLDVKAAETLRAKGETLSNIANAMIRSSIESMYDSIASLYKNAAINARAGRDKMSADNIKTAERIQIQLDYIIAQSSYNAANRAI